MDTIEQMILVLNRMYELDDLIGDKELDNIVKQGLRDLEKAQVESSPVDKISELAKSSRIIR